MGKRTAQKDAIKDITSDSQVNSYFPYRWSPAGLTINIDFYLFLYLYITRITINNGTSHLKSPKNQNRRAALEGPAIKLLGAWSSCGRPTLSLGSVLVQRVFFSKFFHQVFSSSFLNEMMRLNEPWNSLASRWPKLLHVIFYYIIIILFLIVSIIITSFICFSVFLNIGRLTYIYELRIILLLKNGQLTIIIT